MKEEAVILEFKDRLELFIRSKVHNNDDAKDVLQDALVKIFLSYSTLTDADKLTSWVYQITRNTIIDYFRKRKLNVPIVELPEYLSDDRTVNDEVLQCIRPFVEQLPEKYKNALLKTDLGDLSQKAYAQEINLSYSGTKSIVQRARQKLKTSFASCCRIETDTYGQVLDYNPKPNCSCK